MPENIVPEGIRINSVEATILTPNDDIASALGAGMFYLFLCVFLIKCIALLDL